MTGRPRFRLSFNARILIPFVATIVLLLGFVLWILGDRVARRLHIEAEQEVRTSQRVFENALSLGLQLRSRSLPNEPRLRAVARLAEPRTIEFLLSELIAEVGVDVLAFVSADRAVAATAARPGFDASGLDLARAPFVERAVAGGPQVQWAPAGRRAVQLAALPLDLDAERSGVVVIGEAVEEDDLNHFRELTGCEVVILLNQRVAASTLRADAEAVAPALDAWPETALRDVEIGGERYLAARGRLGADGPEAPQYVLLASQEQALRALRSVQRSILLAGAVGLVVSSLIVALAVGRITNPLRALRDSAEAVGQGDFTRQVPVTTQDELGELSRSFNRMTGRLQESRAQLEATVDTLRSTREQLVQSEKLSSLGEFIAGIAHELNNPLTTIIGYAQLMGEAELEERLQRDVRHIGDAAQRCHKIVQNLLSFARQRPPERKPVSVNELLDSTVQFMAYELRTSNVEIRRDYDPRLPPVLADAYQLQQVFLNIVNNARQAIEEARRPGCIQLITTSAGASAQIEIRDNGPGIPAANLSRIFDPFFTTKGAGRGTGLGLSVSYGLVREHGGDIRCESVVGRGTSFHLTLPAAPTDRVAAAHAESTGPAHPALRGEGRAVLVVDDEEPVLELAREILAGVGFSVTAVRDGAEALQRARAQRFDVILCDWKMPGLTGRQFFEKLRETDQAAAARVVFMTGDVLGAATQEYLRDCGKACLAKPFTLDQFRAIVREALG